MYTQLKNLGVALNSLIAPDPISNMKPIVKKENKIKIPGEIYDFIRFIIFLCMA